MIHPPDATPSPSELLLVRLLAELDRTPEAGRVAVVERYLRDYPEHRVTIREVVDADAGVRPLASADAKPTRLQPGQRLGPFRIVRYVAHGGMGEVYEAVQDVLDRRVALKVIRNGFVSPTARARFLREQRVLARLHQTNIVPIHHAGEEGDLQYCAMQFVDGAALHKVVTELYRLESSTLGTRQTPPIREVVDSLMRPTPTASEKPTSNSAKPSAVSETSPPLTLSPSYFASAAAVMIQVAEAVQHGHDREICHRDIKPSNLIIDPSETCWVIDYGLASAATGPSSTGVLPPDDKLDGKLTHGPVGTPQYMAPEQFEGNSDTRSDVWSLGVTLYELLTLRPAFAGDEWTTIRDLVATADPVEPRKLVRNVSKDLAAICRKAMAKDPAQRYPTARAFADDLRRWTRWEPTVARPGWRTLRPLRLLIWRNKAWAASILAVALLLIGSTAWAMQRAEQQKRELEYNRVFAESEEIRHGTPYVGWASDSQSKLKDAQRIRPEADLRGYAAATLIGPDAKLVRTYEVPLPVPGAIVGLAEVAFGPDGQILAGGYVKNRRDRDDRSPALLFDSNLARNPTASTRPGAGPVAFADAATPVQLVFPTGDDQALVLWNVGTNRPLGEIPMPLAGAEDAIAALSSDARLAAVSTTRPPDKAGKRTGVTQLWALDPKTPGAVGKLLKGWDRPASALAFSPDGKYLGVGTLDGTVSLCTTTDGTEVMPLDNGRLPVLSLAFGRNFWKSATDQPRLVPGGLPGRLLAVGTQSGTTYVWDLETKKLVNVLRGTANYVNAVAFGPDGSNLVTAGYRAPLRWNVATGQAEFSLTPHRNDTVAHYGTGVAVSPDGQRVAFTTIADLGGKAGLNVVAFDEDRGIRTLRGLVGQVQLVRVSPTAKWVAALSQNWQVGVWERATGRVAYVWDVPVGWTADNAALAFDAIEESVYFASGERACRLNVATGERTGQWSIPLGLNDNLAIRPGQKPVLLRREPDGPLVRGKASAWSYHSRELLDDGTLRERFPPQPAGPVRVKIVSCDAAGKYAVATVQEEPKTGSLRVYDGATGTPIPLPAKMPFGYIEGGFVTDDGKLLAITGGDADGALVCLYDLPAMTLHSQRRDDAIASLDDASTLGTRLTTVGFRDGLGLFRGGEKRPALAFDLGRIPTTNGRQLTGDGRFCVWGRTDGTVCVADINRCLEQLAAFPER